MKYIHNKSMIWEYELLFLWIFDDDSNEIDSEKQTFNTEPTIMEFRLCLVEF